MERLAVDGTTEPTMDDLMQRVRSDNSMRSMAFMPAATACARVMLFAVLLGLTHAAAASSTQSETIVRVLSHDGRWTTGQLQAVDAERWVLKDALDGVERNIPNREIIAFIAQKSALFSGREAEVGLTAPAPLSLGMLETIDGQRLPGDFRAATEGNYWDHRWIGAIPLSLERVSLMRLSGSRTPSRRDDADTVLFTNGDTAAGFIESLGAELVFEPLDSPEPTTDSANELSNEGTTKPTTEQPSGKRRIPLERVAAIALAKVAPARVGGDEPARGGRIWAVDGSVVDGAQLRFDLNEGWGFELTDGLLSAARPARTTDNNAANPVAGVFAASRLLPLASLGKPALSIPSASFHYAAEGASHIGSSERALLGLASVEFAGPLVAAYELPAATRRQGETTVFSCELVLAEPAPADARVEIEVLLGSTQSQRFVLDATHRRLPVSIRDEAASAQRLEIRISDGGNGIAGDRIELERACFITVAGVSK